MLKELYIKERDSFTVNRCVLGAWRDSLSAEDQEAFDSSISNPDFSLLRLQQLYKAAGITVGATAIRTHRTGNCRCN